MLSKCSSVEAIMKIDLGRSFMSDMTAPAHTRETRQLEKLARENASRQIKSLSRSATQKSVTTKKSGR